MFRSEPFKLRGAFVAGCMLWSVGSGCEVDSDDTDASASDAAQPNDAQQPSDAQQPTDAQQSGDASQQSQSFRYVLVEDLAASEGGEHPGADIDAVALVKADDTITYFTDIRAMSSGSVNEAGALTEPTDPVGCFVGEFASLGGTDGYMILGGAGEFEAGDTIRVHEVGPSDCGPSGAEETSIQVSISPNRVFGEATNLLGTCSSGICNLNITEEALAPVAVP